MISILMSQMKVIKLAKNIFMNILRVFDENQIGHQNWHNYV